MSGCACDDGVLAGSIRGGGRRLLVGGGAGVGADFGGRGLLGRHRSGRMRIDHGGAAGKDRSGGKGDQGEYGVVFHEMEDGGRGGVGRRVHFTRTTSTRRSRVICSSLPLGYIG